MDTRMRRISMGVLLMVAATLWAMPSVSAANGPTTASTWHHGGGAIHWRASDPTYLYSGGSRHAVRGHASMGETDCWGWGMDGMRMTARFQRFVDGHWVTTQKASRGTSWSRSGWHMDDHHARAFAPTFQLRHGDRTHRTRIRYDFGWYDHAKALARRHTVRYP